MTSRAVRVALIGMGRMGRALDALAAERGITVVARLDAADLTDGLSREQLADAEVAIEFTEPAAAVGNAVACLSQGCPIVIGTTGWSDDAGALAAAIARSGCAALASPNFSIGVQIFLAAAEDVARRFRDQPAFDAHIVETHHTAKKDAPSGTGLALGARARTGLGRDIPISSIRVGSVPGTHALIFDAPFEQIRMEHEARDRRVFADGALTAARWLAVGRPPALYSMQDVIASSDPR